MLCQICNQNEATIRYTELINNESNHYYICHNCAKKNNIKIPAGFEDLGKMDIGSLLGLARPAEHKPACATCGTTMDDIIRTGKVGCSECYTCFRRELTPHIHQIHGGVTHTGKIPHSADGKITTKRKIEMLKCELEASVKRQDYENAAKVRDEINKLAKEGQ